MGSMIVRRQLGRRLLEVRKAAGKTREDVAAAEICSVTSLWRIETGKAAIKPGMIWALAALYGLDPEQTEVLNVLAQGTRSHNWWEEYKSAVPPWLGLYAGLEGVAQKVSNYSPDLIHGLLQTYDYAWAVHATDETLDPDTIKLRVDFRMERQRKIINRNAQLMVIMGEAALRIQVGSLAVMGAQEAHLRSLARGRVGIRVMEFGKGAHASMKGAFTILDFDDPDDPATVYLESHTGARYLDQEDHLTQYRKIFTRLVAASTPIEEYKR